MLLTPSLLAGCPAAAPAAPSIVPPLQAAAEVAVAAPQAAVLVVVAALNTSSAPPPDPCDLAKAAFTLLQTAEFVGHPANADLSVAEEWLRVQQSIGQDALSRNETVSLEQLIRWIGACPEDYDVIEKETVGTRQHVWYITLK